jgi:serine/threonine protein kinase
MSRRCTFQDEHHLHFLLEPILGGELKTVLEKREFFESPDTCFVAACITLAFAYLHEQQTAFRDLKPENILLDHRVSALHPSH